MGTNIPAKILAIPGQCVNKISENNTKGVIEIFCSRDKRFLALDPDSGKRGTVNQYVKRWVNDIPMLSKPCRVEVELAQVSTVKNQRRFEGSAFVEKGSRYSFRFCHLISGLCRHTSISVVARHLKLRWETVKNIDKHYLEMTLPALVPEDLTCLKYIGVDEVARAKGHDYMTVVYDMVSGYLIWVATGHKAEVLISFLKRLSRKTAAGIEAVAMDMGKAYQKAVREELPNADIVFD